MSKKRTIVAGVPAGRCRVRILSRDKKFFSSPERPDGLVDPSRPHSVDIGGRSLNLTTRLHLTPKLRMSRAVPLLPTCAFNRKRGKIYLCKAV